MQSLKNKSAIITGAGKGIGRATAIELAKQGVHLGLISRSDAELSALCGELTNTYGIQAVYAIGDISIRSEAEAAADSVIEQLGKIDILINNAGIAKFGTLLEMDPEDWEKMIGVNLLGTILYNSQSPSCYSPTKRRKHY